jgi:hypothetical protein
MARLCFSYYYDIYSISIQLGPVGVPECDELEDIAFRGELPKWLELRAVEEPAGRGGSRNPKNE